MIQGAIDLIFGLIRINMLTLQIVNPCNIRVMSSLVEDLRCLCAVVNL